MSRKTWIRFLLVCGALALALAIVFLASLLPDDGSVTRAKEMVLRDDLFTMRSSINQYTLDKHKPPASLPDLVSAGYLKAIPKDPFTSSSATWRLTPDGNVHSGANGVGSDGKPYNSW